MKNLTRIKKVTENFPYDLLLLADETKESIDKYLFDSDTYLAEDINTGEAIGAFCLYRIDNNCVEIKNIAVSSACQGKGYGSFLLGLIAEMAAEEGYKEIIVGTGEAGLRQINFYEKNGYAKYGLKKDFFTLNYPSPVYENCMQLIDMVMLRKEISRGQASKI